VTGRFTSGFRAEAPGDVRVIVFLEDLERARSLLAETHSDDESPEGGNAAATALDRDFEKESSESQEDSWETREEKKRAFQFGLAALLILQTAVGVVLSLFKLVSLTALGALILTGAVTCAMLYAVILATVYIASDLERRRFFARAGILVLLVGVVAVELLVLLWAVLR
jgi:uncharacterized membrane protein YdbT with pleckstrin-like domain